MENELNFYIDGAWVPPVKSGNTRDVINPATEKPIAKISMGTAEDVDKAVKAARRAFESYSRTTRAERIALMQRIMGAYQAKYEEMAKTISSEMGAPIWLSKAAQAAMFMAHFGQAIEVLKSYEFEEKRGKTQIIKRAGRRLRPDHAVELADQPDRVQGRAGAGGGLHRGAEADRGRAAQRHAARADHARRGRARRACSTW